MSECNIMAHVNNSINLLGTICLQNWLFFANFVLGLHKVIKIYVSHSF